MSLLLLLRPPVAQKSFAAAVTPSAVFVRKPLMLFQAAVGFVGSMKLSPKVSFASALSFIGVNNKRVTVPKFTASVSFVGSQTRLRLNALRAFAASIQPFGKGGKGPVGYIDVLLPPYKWVERIYQIIARWD